MKRKLCQKKDNDVKKQKMMKTALVFRKKDMSSCFRKKAHMGLTKPVVLWYNNNEEVIP